MNIKHLKMTEIEAAKKSVDFFTEWYTSGIPITEVKTYEYHKEHIAKTLKYHEFSELLSYVALKELGYEILFSNIHFRVNMFNALGVDLFARKLNNAFFVEAKGVEVHTWKNVNSNINEANHDIDKRMLDIYSSVLNMKTSNFSIPDIKTHTFGGIGFVTTKLNSSHWNMAKSPKHETYVLEVDVDASMKKVGGKYNE